MKINLNYTLFLLFIIQISFAQKKDESIGTEVVNVVKAYTPTICDAFKIMEIPPIDDEAVNKKEVLKYSIFSIPVASTFTPNKGVAAKVDVAPTEQLYDNFAVVGLGNYGTVNAQLSVTKNLENSNYISANFNHLSSQGGIKNIDLSDKFYETLLDATYGFKTKPLSYKINAGIQNQVYNWYGLDPTISNSTILNQINPNHSFNTLNLDGQIQLSESILNETNLSFLHFSDSFKSSENRVVVQPKLELDVLNEKVKVNFNFDYLSGNFKNDFSGGTTINYGFTNVGIQPNFKITQDDLSVNLGLSIIYSVANQEGKNKFFIYPNITASYNIVGNLMIGFAGAEGGLLQNSYHDFAQINNFVSPNLLIIPTDRKLNIYAGLRGKLSTAIGYNLKASFVNEDYKPLFKNNIYTSDAFFNPSYAFGNSFEIIYDNVKTVSVSGELSADLSKNMTFKIQGIFNKYVLSNQAEAWNLPNLQINSNFDFKIANRWKAGFKLFYIGERKDQYVQVSNSSEFILIDKTLNGYFDLNAHLNYQHSKQLGFFIKGNNLVNQSYQRWLNYPVQGIQALIGANYKFDF